MLRGASGEALQDAWQPGAGEVLRSADAQAVADRRAVQPGAGLALQLDDVAGIGVERLARLGQLQAASGAAEQADAGCLFQALDMPADCGGVSARLSAARAKPPLSTTSRKVRNNTISRDWEVGTASSMRSSIHLVS